MSPRAQIEEVPAPGSGTHGRGSRHGGWEEEQQCLPSQVFAVSSPGPALVSLRKNWWRQRASGCVLWAPVQS